MKHSMLGTAPSPFKLMKFILQVMCLAVCIPSDDLCSLRLVLCGVDRMMPSCFHEARTLGHLCAVSKTAEWARMLVLVSLL